MVTIPAAGHAVMSDNPKGFLLAVEHFLEALSGATSRSDSSPLASTVQS
jgi:hypothetical protein